MRRRVLTLAVAVVTLVNAHAARVLGVFAYPSRSHFAVSAPFMEALAERGHDVVVASHFPRRPDASLYREVDLRGTAPLKVDSYDLSKVHSIPTHRMYIDGVWGGSVARCQAVLGLPAFRSLLSQSFDLLVTEVFGSECFLALGHHFRVPVVSVFTSEPFPWNIERLGNPNNPAYVAAGDRSLPARMQSTIRYLLVKLGFWWYSERPTQTAVWHLLDPTVPPLAALARNTSLVLLNTHPALNGARPWVPGVLEVGGIHIGPAGQLPREVDDFLSGATNGVIYFSLGSMIRAQTMPQAQLRALQQAFSELPQRVLWKWEGDMEEKPQNVMTATWLPQRDILAHPNVRAFITHGGLLGVMEAVHFGVPMVIMPIFGDQSANAAGCVERGVAVAVNFENMTSAELRAAIQLLLIDPEYHRRAGKLSAIFRDRPQTALETAVFWTEYVLRHEGAEHLRSAAADLAWYQYLLLDVVATLCMVVYAVYQALCAVWSPFLKSRPKGKKLKKK